MIVIKLDSDSVSAEIVLIVVKKVAKLTKQVKSSNNSSYRLMETNSNFRKEYSDVNSLLTLSSMIAVCTYRLVMMSIDLSKKFTLHLQTVTGEADLKVTQLLRCHMPLLYCMQLFNL